MGRYCVHCGKRGKCVSLHQFPKDKQIREQWLSFCGLDEEDLTTATFLCSDHFDTHKLSSSNKRVARRSWIPSIENEKKEKLNECASVAALDTPLSCKQSLTASAFPEVKLQTKSDGNTAQVMSQKLIMEAIHT